MINYESTLPQRPYKVEQLVWHVINHACIVNHMPNRLFKHCSVLIYSKQNVPDSVVHIVYVASYITTDCFFKNM